MSRSGDILAAAELEESKFKKLVGDLERKGEPEKEADAVAAIAGRKKLGKAKFDAKAAAGRKKADK
jgi:hypothetical protein